MSYLVFDDSNQFVVYFLSFSANVSQYALHCIMNSCWAPSHSGFRSFLFCFPLCLTKPIFISIWQFLNHVSHYVSLAECNTNPNFACQPNPDLALFNFAIRTYDINAWLVSSNFPMVLLLYECFFWFFLLSSSSFQQFLRSCSNVLPLFMLANN